MNRDDALTRLPEMYALVLRMRDQGFDDATIAAQLEIPVQAARPLLSIAEAKLAQLLADTGPEPASDAGAGVVR